MTFLVSKFAPIQIYIFLFKVIINGIRGGDYFGEAALDDVSFQKGPCHQPGIGMTICMSL